MCIRDSRNRGLRLSPDTSVAETPHEHSDDGPRVQRRARPGDARMTFAAFAALGYGSRLIPIIPPGAPISERSNLFKRIQAGEDGRGKIPGVRWPDGRWSGFDWRAHATIETDLPRWDSMGAGVGIRLDDGLVAIDADTLHEDRALAIKATIEKWIGCAPARIGRWPKVLYLVRTTAPYRYARVEFGHANGHPRERVEILSSGRQFVAEGIHPVTREAYRWPAGLPSVESLPVVALSLIHI